MTVVHCTDHSKFPPPPMAQMPLVGQGLIIEASRSHSDTSHSVGLLWTSDQPYADTSTWQHPPRTRNRHPCSIILNTYTQIHGMCQLTDFNVKLDSIYRVADKSLARPDWKNNWKVAIFRQTRRSLLPRRPGWTDKCRIFFLSGLQKLEFGRCSLFPSWSG